ncbi:MAG: hypothetical protein AAF565_21850, partial [Pseudomonadota bacterium]
RMRLTLVLDWVDWLGHLEGLDATEAEKSQLIETVWTIIVAFVDLGWEVAATKPCGQDLDLAAALRAAVLNSTEKEDA